MAVRKVVWLVFPRGHAASGDSIKLFFCIEGKQCVVLVRMERSRRVKSPWKREEEIALYYDFTSYLYDYRIFRDLLYHRTAKHVLRHLYGMILIEAAEH